MYFIEPFFEMIEVRCTELERLKCFLVFQRIKLLGCFIALKAYYLSQFEIFLTLACRREATGAKIRRKRGVSQSSALKSVLSSVLDSFFWDLLENIFGLFSFGFV